MNEANQLTVAARRTHWARFIPPVVLLLATLTVTVIAITEAHHFRQQPFPGFFAYSSGLVSPMQRSEWEGRVAGLRPGDRLVRIDGVPFGQPDVWRKRIAQRPLGDKVRVEARRDSRRLEVDLTLREFSNSDVLITLATPFAIGIFYLLIGVVLFFLKPRSEIARLVLALLLSIALFYVTTFDANTTWQFERVWICYPLFGAIAVHLFTVFPEELAFARRHRWVRGAPYAMAVVLVLFRHIYLGDAEGTTNLAYASTVFLTAVTITNFLLLGLGWRQTRSQVVVRKVKVIAVGLLFTSTLGVVWSFAARVDPEATTWDFAMLLSAPFPILITYAVLKQNIFDVDGVLRQTVTYGLSTVLVLALYLAVVAVFTLVTQQYLPFYETTVTAVLATLAVALAFHPLRVRVQRLVTRVFAREKYDLGKAITDLSQELSRVTDVESLGRVFTARLQKLLGVESAVLYVGARHADALSHAGSAGEVPPQALQMRISMGGALAKVMRSLTRPRLVSTLAEGATLPADEVSRLALAQVRLAVPLVQRDALVGVLFVGGRRFEHVFSDQDLQLLETMQTPLAIAIENAILYTERAAQERLAALGQVATYIIHEVKNPLAIIRTSIGTIKRRLVDDRSKELAAMVEEEVERMNRTTAKILNFARARSAEVQRCDVGQVVTRVLSFVEPELASRGVTLGVHRGASEPVPVDAEQIEAMVLNLVLNARDATPSGGRVDVHFGAADVEVGAGRGAYEIVVEDTGAGMDAETRARLFTPFFTTRRGGTGLGLAIVRHIVEAHAGEIYVESEVGRGTRFVVHLPLEHPTATAATVA